MIENRARHPAGLRAATDRPLEGRGAVVTGGARGLGEAISRTLAAAGASVVIADVRDELSVQVAASIVDAGERAIAEHVDLCDDTSAQQLIKRAIDRVGRLDILVNNAGIDETVPVEELSIARWDEITAVNLRAPFILAQRAFTVMREAGGGSIVNITSTAARRAWANAAAYHASKWGLLGLSHALHVEGRPHNIKVTAIVAGGMRTPFLLDRFADLDPAVLQPPEHVARAVVFALTQPAETVIPEMLVLPMGESSWP